MIKFIQRRKIWLSISGAAVAASVIFLLVWGLKFGIDFTGGSLLEINFINQRPSPSEASSVLEDLSLGSLLIQPVDEKGMILRFQDTTEEKHQETLNRLAKLSGGENATASSEIDELRFDSVGPSIGQELKEKSLTAIVLVVVFIVLYIAWCFRRVSRPVESWKYGVAAVIALFHDVIITIGVFSFLGEFYGVEINSAFVAAILTVLGYSVNDTIVVFDRIRENLPKSDTDFEETVNLSINQTIVRSIYTSATVLLVLFAILAFGGPSIRAFVFALAVGVFVGTYSSIFIASPLLVIWEKLKFEKK